MGIHGEVCSLFSTRRHSARKMLFSASLLLLCIAPARVMTLASPMASPTPDEMIDAISDKAIEFAELMAAHLTSNLGDGNLRDLAFPCEKELNNIKRYFPDCAGVWAERANTTNITSGWALSTAECTPSCHAVFASVAALSNEQCLTSTSMPAGITTLAQSLDAYCMSALPHVIDIASAPDAETMKAETAEYLDAYLPTWGVRLLMLPIGGIINAYWRVSSAE